MRRSRSACLGLTALLALGLGGAVRPAAATWAPDATAGVAVPGQAQERGSEAEGAEERDSAAVDQVPDPATRDSDGDGVRDVRDACPGTEAGARVNELGCVERGGAWVKALLVGGGVFLLVALGFARWWYGQPVPEEPMDKEWVVLPVSSAAKDAGIRPAPRSGAPPGAAGRSSPLPGGGGYPPAPGAPGAPGYPPPAWPSQQGYYAPQPYPGPAYGGPGYPTVPYPTQQPPTQQPPPGGQPAPPAPPRPESGGPAQAGNTPPDPWGTPAQPTLPRVAPEEPIPEGETIDEGHVRFHRPPEGTLQLLPGRLDVVGGDPGRGGIRFVKIPSENPEVTFGRSSGPQYRHIQLKIPTVSRMHARMWYEGGGWSIENLSETNPVVVNGETMGLGRAAARSLHDGDSIEMGEVVFRYWI